jgi:hypothetical protein
VGVPADTPEMEHFMTQLDLPAHRADPAPDLPALFAQVEGSGLAGAAVTVAAAGVPIFPCVAGGKTPLTARGFHNATTNPDRVGAWWVWRPGANIAVPTGQTSRIDVVDVDRRLGVDGFAAFRAARDAGLLGGWLALVRTPSGGMHAYYPAQPGRPQPSWAAGRAKVDFRADGGYVLIPPSVVVSVQRVAGYTLIAGPEGPPAPVDGALLRRFLDPRPTITPRHRNGAQVNAADRLAAWVAARSEGERNRGLFWASCRLAETGMAVTDMHAALSCAAQRAGLPPGEIATTIASAYRIVNAHTPTGPHPRPDTTFDANLAAARPQGRPGGWVLA